MPMKLAILSLLTNVLSTHQANYYQVMEDKRHTINFMVAHCFMMQLLVLSGLRNKPEAGETLMAKERFEQ